MSMQLSVENFFRVNKADIPLATGEKHITLIAGYHGAGKSSTLTALQALVTGEGMPLADTKKKDASFLVTRGEKSAKASLKWSEGVTEVKWPTCKVTGPKFKCSPYAAGLLPPALIPAKNLSQILNVLPSKEDFLNEMSYMFDLEPDDFRDLTDGIWSKIESDGWDKAHERAVQRRQELKRDWARLANQDSPSIVEWSVKSNEWTPVHLVNETLDTLEKSLESARKIHEHSIKRQALSEKAREDLQALADQIADGSAEKAVEHLQKLFDELNEKLEKAETLKREIPQALNPQQTYKCWSCGEFNCLEDGQMVKPAKQVDESEQEALRQKLQEATDRIKELSAKRYDTSIELNQAKSHQKQCEDARLKLKTAVLDEEEPAMSPEAAREEIELCERRILAHKIKEECDEIDQFIRNNDHVCGVLDPEGLRRNVLVTKLAEFNELLSQICDVAGWGKVEIDEFFNVLYDGYLYKYVSKAQKLVVNIALQIAIAKNDGSQMVIIDDIETLKGDMRNGLFEILDAISVPCVIGCAFKSKDIVPDISDYGLAYWCENGTVNVLELVSQ